MTHLKFVFSNQSESTEFELIYQLFETPFKDKWLRVFREALNDSQGLREHLFFGSLFEAENTLVSEINRVIEKINHFKPQSFVFKEKATLGMSHQDLMILHSEFEEAEKLELFRQDAPQQIKSDLLKVNELIHRYQATLEPGSEFHINCVFKNPKSYPFDPEDLELFSPHYYDGWLYLDYATTGVTVFDAHRFKTPQKPVPQTTYQGGCKLLFDGNRERGSQELNTIKDWMKSRWDMDASDPWNTLGYIPLGKLHHPTSRDEVEEGLRQHHHRFRVEVID